MPANKIIQQKNGNTGAAVAEYPRSDNDSSIETAKHSQSDADHIHAFTKELLIGKAHFGIFDTTELHEITHDVRLLHSYEYSGACSVSEFLAKGRERMKLRNHGRGSEKKLHEAILNYITEQQLNLPEQQITAQPPTSIDHDGLLEQLKRPGPARSVVSGRIWKLMTDELKASEFADQLIAPTAAEIDMAWPFSLKSAFSNRRIGDFLGHSLSELHDLDRFGRKRVRTYAACVTYLHKLLTNGDSSENISLKDTVLSLWKNSRLRDREQKVLHLRFGIQDERKHTLEEIKEYFGITRERVRQIEKQALIKLRMSRHFEELPGLILENKDRIWEQLTQDSKLRKREWMEPLEDQLGFEYQLAMELIDYRKNRNPGASALYDWLDRHFPHDETYWYKDSEQRATEPDNHDQMNGSLMAFLDEL